MPFSAGPSGWFGAGYTASSNAIHLTTNDAGGTKALTLLTDAEAHASTGDVRKVNLAICEKLYQDYNGKAAADRPAKMIFARSDQVNSQTGVVTRTYSFQFKLSAPAVEVADE